MACGVAWSLVANRELLPMPRSGGRQLSAGRLQRAVQQRRMASDGTLCSGDGVYVRLQLLMPCSELCVAADILWRFLYSSPCCWGGIGSDLVIPRLHSWDSCSKVRCLLLLCDAHMSCV